MRVVYRSMICLMVMMFGGLPGVARAEVPKVATDIAPVYGLAARVMQGVGTPSLLIAQGASPHGYAMRPSEASALSKASHVYWIGEELSPWLERPIETLAGKAQVVALGQSEGTLQHDWREGAAFELEIEEDEHHDHGHAHGHDHGHDHGEGQLDPHSWLNPDNAKLWLNRMAEDLAQYDPENADTYRTNARDGAGEIDSAVDEVRQRLGGGKAPVYIVFHDSFQYFERYFGVSPVGAVADGAAVPPGPARISALRQIVKDSGVQCAFNEVQQNDRPLRTVLEGTQVTIGALDALGFDVPLDQGFYPALLRHIGSTIANCH